MNSSASTNTILPTSFQSTPQFKENSRASVFSTIVALCLCCLTQPRGGLLFPGRSDWFWRLSPFAALLEAVMIVFCLLFRRSLDAHRVACVRELQPILGVTHLAAAPFSDVFKFRDRRILHSLKRLKLEFKLLLAWMGFVGGFRTCAAVLVVLRSRGDPEREVSADQVRGLLVTRGMRRTQIWTTTSMIFLIIKLCAVKGAPWFTGLGLSYAVSWMAVEAIVLIVDWRGLEDEDVEGVMKEFPKIQTVITSRLWSRLWSTSSGLFGASIVGYLVYSTLWRFDSPFQVLKTLGNGLVLLFTSSRFLMSLVARSRNNQAEREEPATHLMILVIPAILIAEYIVGGQHVDPDQNIAFSLLYSGYVMISILGVGLGGSLLILLVICPVVASRRLADDTEEYYLPAIIRGRAVGFANIAIFGGGLALYMYYYDAEGTVKPDWLEWIGM